MTLGIEQADAELVARLYPYLKDYPYGISAYLAASFTQLSHTLMLTRLKTLKRAGVMTTPRRGAWVLAEGIKERLDATY